jgi:hypothetical protein
VQLGNIVRLPPAVRFGHELRGSRCAVSLKRMGSKPTPPPKRPARPLRSARLADFMAGEFDDFAIFSRSLSSTEIASLAAGGSLPTGNMLARWKFDVTGNTVPDVSGNGHDLTLFGGAAAVNLCH